MTSSVLDGAGIESPAPPAFSPLTDADPGNREPSVNVSLPSPASGKPVDSHATSKPNGIQHADANTTQSDLAAAAAALANADPMDLDGMAAMDGSMDIDYTGGAGLGLYQQNPTHILMALARMSAATQPQHMVLPPSTVRPSQVSLPHAMLDGPDALLQTPNAAHIAPPVNTPLESFARIEFADSVFQMTTYAVTIGRDQRALDVARKDERRHDDYQRRVRENEQLGLPAPSPPTHDRGKFSKSYVSEEGGMLGPESDGEDNLRPAKRRKTSGNGGASASGDSHQQEAAMAEQAAQEEKNTAFNRQYVSHTPGAAAVDLSALRPSPHYVPFIGIHSPGPNIASRTKAISREHLRIQFNQKEGVFEAVPLHKNGFFCEDVHYKDAKVVLRSGDHLQIKDVDFVFIINGVPQGKTGAEGAVDEDGASSRRYSEGGKEMSFDFESSHGPERRSTSPEEAAVEVIEDDSDSELSDPADDDMGEAELEEETPEQEVMETIEKDNDAQPSIKPEMPLDLLSELPAIPKKRGPGRPPKNGIMSKREERLRKKAAMELAKKNMPQPPPGEPPIKRKVGRPRKHPLPENTPDRPEKRKYKPRKSKTGEEGEGSEGEKIMKERRREKPKTPPLELNRDDYTEEQLQKPNKNYGVLIDEVLSVAPDGLTLKQIYKRIQMKYPFYYFTVDTKGWESSVRHNLIGNDAFKKNEETHLWSRVPGIDIDAGKKRKANSPDHSTSLHTFGQHYPSSTTPTPMFHGEAGSQGYRTGSVPQRTGYPTGHGQMSLGQLQQQHLGTQGVGAATQQAPRPAYPTTTQLPGAAPTAGFGDPAARRPSQGSAQATAYSSPYTSRPPPTATIPPSGVPGATRPGVPPHHVPSPYNGLPRVDALSAHTGAPGPVGARPAQPAAINGNALPLKPAVAPELVRHVTNFKTTVTEQLSKRTTSAEAVAMSVINRGLGLAAESTVPDEEGLEKIVLGVFESSRQKLGANQFLHTGLVQALVNFKTSMTKTLEPRMGKLNSERLILSAVDRVLGFADRSTMPGPESDRKQYDEAETVLIPAIKRVVTEHQRTLAAVAVPSGPRPGPAPSAPSAPPASNSTPIPAKVHAPAINSAAAASYSATAHLNTTKPAHTAPMTGHPLPAPARPPVSAPVSASPTKPITPAAPAQQAPAGASAQILAKIAATLTSQPPAQVPGSALGQTPAQAAGRTVASAGAQGAPALGPALPQATAQAAARTQPQAPNQLPGTTPIQRPVSTQVPGTTPTQGPAPASTTAPIAPRASSQSTPLPNSTGSTVPRAPLPGAVPTSQNRAQEPTPAKPQAPAQNSAPAATQRASLSGPIPGTASAPAPAAPQRASLSGPIPGIAPALARSPATSQLQTAPTTAPTPQAPAQTPAKAAVPAPARTPVPASAPSLGPPPLTHALPPKPPAPVQAPQPQAAAPVANMATVTAPAAAPPPTPPPATVTAAR